MYSAEHFRVTAVAGLLCLLSSSAAVAQAPTSSAPDRRLRIGLFEPDAAWADRIQAGALEAQAEWNGRGGVAGSSLELVRLPSTAPWRGAGAQLARFIVEHDLCALIGPSDSASAHIAVQVATRLRVPIIALSADPTLTAAKDPWIFAGVPSDLEQARALLRRALPRPEGRAALLVVPPGRAGRPRLVALKRACAELGVEAGELLDEQDVVLLWLDPAPAKTFLQEFGRGLGETFVLGSLRLRRREFLEPAARATTRLLLPEPRDGSHELGAALGYDAFDAIARAAETFGTSRDAIREGLTRLPTRSPRSGLVGFEPRATRAGPTKLATLRSHLGLRPPPLSDSSSEQRNVGAAPATGE